MTRSDHRSGTERVAEVAASSAGRDAEIIVNVQGDEPLIDPAAVDAAVEVLLNDATVEVATLAVPIAVAADVMDPNVVKVVLDFQGNALYFSRAPIPWVRSGGAGQQAFPHFKDIGLLVFRRSAPLEFSTLPPGATGKLAQLGEPPGVG